jgi:signal transduction histidine kinase
LDIQSKKIRYSLSLKIIAWVLCMAGMCAAGWGVLESYINGWADIQQSYVESSEYKSFVQDGSQIVFYAFYINENDLQGEIKSQTDGLNAERANKIASLNSEAKSPGDEAQLIAAINQLYDSQIESAKNAILNEYEQMHAKSEAKLADRKDLLYAVVVNGAITKTNIQDPNPIEFIKKLNYSQNTFSKAGELAAQPSPAVAVDQAANLVTVYIAMPKEVFAQKESQYQTKVSDNQMFSIWMISGLACFAVGFVWLMYMAGRKPDGGEITLQWSDAIPLDAGFVLLCFIEAACVFMLSFPKMHSANTFADNLYNFTFIASGASAWNLWFISLAKRIKLKKAAKYTVVYMLFGGLHRLYVESGTAVKTVWLTLLWMLGIFISTGFFVGGFYIQSRAASAIGFILLIVLAALILRFLLKKAAAVKKITGGLARMQEGELDHVLQPTGGRELDAIAEGINHITDGFKAAVGKEVRAERMKTELITNISHDLRTPLTSIITYVDLLKKEETSENVKKYVEVLDEKSSKLKALTDDLFEAAKAASGDIAVNMNKIELVQFMQQALGELNDRIQQSGLVFITDMPDDKMYICADGKLLWRVFGNVMDNVFKYALEGSRVYIDMKRKKNNISITVKNISREPLNMPGEELMERFRRGDASRHTDGSGLGLAIAKDLMRIMDCGFGIEIDGDLFKVYMNFKETNS